MLKLGLKKEPYWLELPLGVRLQVVPMSTPLMARVQAERAEDGADAEGEASGTPSPAEANLSFVKAVARHAILDWDGVGDEKGKPAPVEAAYVDALLDEYPIYRAFQAEYVSTGMALVQEGNGSAPSPNGTSAAARNTARTAKASAKPARRGKTGR